MKLEPRKTQTTLAKNPVKSVLMEEIDNIPRYAVEKESVVGHIEAPLAQLLKKKLRQDGITVKDFIFAAAKAYLRERE